MTRPIETPGEVAARELERKLSPDLVRNEPMVQLLLSRVRAGAFSAEDGLIVVLDVALRELRRLRELETRRALADPLVPMVIAGMVFTPPGWTREGWTRESVAYADAHKPRLGGTGCADDCKAHPPHVPEPMFKPASGSRSIYDELAARANASLTVTECDVRGCRPGCPHVAPNGDRGIQKS